MSSTTAFSISLPSMPALTAETTQSTTSVAPLQQILPYLYSLPSLLVYLLSLVSSVIKLLFKPFVILSPYPIVLIRYLVAPLLTAGDVLLDTCVRFPYAVLLYVLDALYPVYVLCGVACILGLVVGLCGRVIVSGLLALTLRETSNTKEDHDIGEITKPEKKPISEKKHGEARERPDKRMASKSKSGVNFEA